MQGKDFPVWLRNRLISGGLEQVLSQIKIKIIKLIPALLDRAFGSSWLTKRVLILDFYFNIRGKLSTIRCGK